MGSVVASTASQFEQGRRFHFAELTNQAQVRRGLLRVFLGRRQEMEPRSKLSVELGFGVTGHGLSLCTRALSKQAAERRSVLAHHNVGTPKPRDRSGDGVPLCIDRAFGLAPSARWRLAQ